MTVTEYRTCHCGEQLAVEIPYAASREPDGTHVEVNAEHASITDIQCPHAPQMLAWVTSAEGVAWCEAQVEAALAGSPA